MSQNRSVEGDEVALRILPPCGWWVFKREQLKAAQKAAAKGPSREAQGPSREAQGVDLAGTPNAATSEVATPAGRLPLASGVNAVLHSLHETVHTMYTRFSCKLRASRQQWCRGPNLFR